MNKTAASAGQFVKCILLHTYSRKTVARSYTEHKKKLHIAYLTSWHNGIFGYKLRTIRLKIL